MVDPKLLATVKMVIFDFDGVFTDNTVYVTEAGIESVRCWRSDGLGLARLRSIGVHIVIISTETNSVVTVRAKKLNLPCRQAIENKEVAVLEICRELNVSPTQTMFVGNDINDIPAFKTVGIPVAVANAYPEIYPHVRYRTHKPGGFGAVREMCDLVFHAKQGSLNALETHAS